MNNMEVLGTVVLFKKKGKGKIMNQVENAQKKNSREILAISLKPHEKELVRKISEENFSTMSMWAKQVILREIRNAKRRK